MNKITKQEIMQIMLSVYFAGWEPDDTWASKKDQIEALAIIYDRMEDARDIGDGFYIPEYEYNVGCDCEAKEVTCGCK